MAFIANATQGMNAVLQSQPLHPGDEMLALDHVYGAVRNTLRHVAARTGAVLTTATLPWPRPQEAAILDAITAAITPRTRIAVIDHITSASAIVLPIARIVALCHAQGVPVLVDGAHGPGQVDLDLTALDADWYVGNCHKWLMAPKGAAFLWARRDRQIGLHPTSISHGYGGGFLAEFDWTGTTDPSAWLAVPDAIDFHTRLGGPALQAANAALAGQAATMLADQLGSETGHGNAACGAMAMVRLPLAGQVDAARALALRTRLLAAGADAPVSAIGQAAWLRISAQAYNEPRDYHRLLACLRPLLTQG